MIRRIKLHINLDQIEKVLKVKFSNDLQALAVHPRKCLSTRIPLNNFFFSLTLKVAGCRLVTDSALRVIFSSLGGRLLLRTSSRPPPDSSWRSKCLPVQGK
jgi:hypothetical protein